MSPSLHRSWWSLLAGCLGVAVPGASAQTGTFTNPIHPLASLHLRRLQPGGPGGRCTPFLGWRSAERRCLEEAPGSVVHPTVRRARLVRGGAAAFTSPDDRESWFAYWGYHVYDTAKGLGTGPRVIMAQRLGWRADGTPDFGLAAAPGQPRPLPSGDPGLRR